MFDLHRFRCNVCDKTIRCDHMGKQDLIKHSKTQYHMERAKSFWTQSRLNFSSHVAGTANEAMKRTEAEVRTAILTASCNAGNWKIRKAGTA